jgi:hypothetical protein
MYMPTKMSLAELARKHGQGPINSSVDELFLNGLRVKQRVNDQKYLARYPDGESSPHVSDAGKCPRKVWLGLKNLDLGKYHEPTNDLNTLANFAFGHACEAAVSEVLELCLAQVHTQATIRLEHEGVSILGSSDIIAVHPKGGIIEVKTTSERSMSYRLKEGEPRDEHRRQLNLYIHAARLGRLTVDGKRVVREEVNCGTIVYVVPNVKRGDRPFWPWLVRYDEAQAFADLTSLAAIAKAETMPEIPAGYTASGYPCSYCEYKCHLKGFPDGRPR